MFKIVSKIIKKELTEIFRDKMCVVILLIPLLVFPVLNYGISLFGDAQNSNQKQTMVCVISESGNEYLDSYLSENQKIKVIETNNPYSSLKNNEIELIIESDDNKNVEFIFNSASFKSLLSATKLGEDFDKYIKQEIKKDYPEAVTVNIKNENGVENAADTSVSTMISPIIFIILLMQGCNAFANDMFAGEKERKTFELLLLSGVKRKYIYIGKVFALMIMELLNMAVCIISFLLSFSMLKENSSLTNTVLNASPANILCIIISCISLCLTSVFTASTVSLFSSKIRTSQNINEIASSIPIICAAAVMFGTISPQNKWHLFIPFFNTIQELISSYFGSYSITNTLLSAFVNLILCALMVKISSVYMNSEKIIR